MEFHLQRETLQAPEHSACLLSSSQEDHRDEVGGQGRGEASLQSQPLFNLGCHAMFPVGLVCSGQRGRSCNRAHPDNRAALASYSWLSYPQMNVDLTPPQPKKTGALSHVSSSLY